MLATIYLVDLLLDLEARFAALMGRIISSFAPSGKEKPGPAGRRHDAVDRRAPLPLPLPPPRGSIAPITGVRGNPCMIIAPEFAECLPDKLCHFGRHQVTGPLANHKAASVD